MIITIDGPAGSGKSTIAKRLATSLDFFYINSGLFYRTIAYNTVGISDENKIIQIASNSNLDNINESILRTDIVSLQASKIAAIKQVRAIVTKQQRKLATSQDVILEGRDAGTVVFPNADFKFFLTASLEERAKRRAIDLKQKDIEKIKQMILARDQADRERIHSPLTKSSDTIEIDTTKLSIEEVISAMMTIINNNRRTSL